MILEEETTRHSIKCANDNPCQLFCSSEGCLKSAFICRKERCPCLGQIHPNCQFIYAQTLIKKIRGMKIAAEATQQNTLTKNQQTFLQMVNSNNTSPNMNGDFIFKIKKDLKQQNIWTPHKKQDG